MSMDLADAEKNNSTKEKNKEKKMSSKKTSEDVSNEKKNIDTFESESAPAAPRSKKATVKVVLCILVMELCERLTYYSILANLVLFCTSRLGFNSETANYIVQIFSGKTSLFFTFYNTSYNFYNTLGCFLNV